MAPSSSGDRDTWLASLANQFAPGYDPLHLLWKVQDAAVKHASADEIRQLWASHFARSDAHSRLPVHLYVHIPFCQQICKYCCYYKVQLAGESQVDRYLDWLTDALTFFAPTFAGQTLQTSYIGGGTPSVLSPPQLDRLLEVLFSRFAVAAGGERGFECDPGSVTPEKIDVLARRGINRISMGVQSTSGATLEAENRGYQTADLVERAVELIKARGIVLNLDLILGLKGESGQQFIDSFRHIASLRPSQICVYPLAPTNRYFETVHAGTDRRDYLNGLRARFGGVPPGVVNIARECGYWSNSEIAVDGQPWLFSRQVQPFTPYSDMSRDASGVFGIGPTARSRIPGSCIYTAHEGIPDNLDPQQLSYRVSPLRKDDDIIEYIYMRCRRGLEIDPEAITQSFGRAFPAGIASDLEELERAKRVRKKGRTYLFSDDPRQRFLSAAQLLPDTDLRKRLVTDIVVGAPEPMTFRISSVLADSGYLVSAGEIGLSYITSGAQKPERTHTEIIELARDVFKNLAARDESVELPEFSQHFRERFDSSLDLVRQRGHLGALPVEVVHPPS
jgi:oxygen-independent coproporphyrinogen-3 oxidase